MKDSKLIANELLNDIFTGELPDEKTIKSELLLRMDENESFADRVSNIGVKEILKQVRKIIR